ncbi:unnamed protein product [Toxocara canis]|uniref:Lipoprotein n=1 Tax=Toxocara canis TaxID=6265 RepID=A0A183UYH9_TOXCA|nr:unnamed protein product [Toxocara canis]
MRIYQNLREISTGCRTNNDRPLEIGETYVDDNVAHQCFRKESAIYYRQSVCGMLGQPDCNKLTTDVVAQDQSPSSPTGFIDQLHGMPALEAAGLPEGWRIVDAQGKPIPLSSIRVISRTVPVVNQRTVTVTGNASGNTPFTEITLNIQQQQRRRRRQTSSVGVGSAVPVDITTSEETRRNKDERVVGIGTGSVSLDSRKPTVRIGGQQYLPGTVAGTRSDVTWSGKTEMHNGRRIAVGPGTFTFGNSPTGFFVKKTD